MGYEYENEDQDSGLGDISNSINNASDTFNNFNRLSSKESEAGNTSENNNDKTSGNKDDASNGDKESNSANGSDKESGSANGQGASEGNNAPRPKSDEVKMPSASASGNVNAGANASQAAGGSATAGTTSGGAAATGGAAAGGTAATAGGTAAAGGGAAASGGGAAAAGATANPVGATAIGIIILVAIIPVLSAIMIMIAGVLLTYLNPLNLVKVVEQAIKNVGYTIVDEIEQDIEEIVYIFKNGELEPTSDGSLRAAKVDIPIAYIDYNPLNPQERAMIEEYKLIAVALSRAYDAEVQKVIDKCKEKKYDVALTQAYIRQTYPEGWKTVFKDVNYAEVMALLHFYVEKHEDKWKDSEGVLDGIKNDMLHSGQTGNYTFTYTGVYLSEISELLFLESKQRYYCDTAVVVKEKDGKEYLQVEIKPFCWNEMYQVVNIEPNDEYDNVATYADFHAAMNENMKYLTLDVWGNPPAIYYTVGMDRPGVGWNNNFRGIEITELLLSKNVLSAVNEKNRELTYSLIRAAGYDDEVAAGICGYLHNISGFNTLYLESTDTVGIGQWSGSKLSELYAYAEELNMSPTDIHVQIHFLIKDMESLKKYEIQEIRASKDEKEAAINFAYYYAKEPAFLLKNNWKESDYGNVDSKKYVAWERYGKTNHGYMKDADTIIGLAVLTYAMYEDQSIYEWPMPSSLDVGANYGAFSASAGSNQGLHNGIDIKGKAGANIISASDGTVIEVGTDEELKKYVKIQYLDDIVAEYYHLGSVIVKEGDTVRKRQMIGYLAAGDGVVEPHLHFALSVYNSVDEERKYTSPWRFLNKPEGVIEDEACTECDIDENTYNPKYTDKKCSMCNGEGCILIYDDWLNSDYWMTSYAGCSQCGGSGRIEYMSGPDDYVDEYRYVPGSGYFGRCNHYPYE